MCKASDHSGLSGACHRTDNHVVEGKPKLAFLILNFKSPTGKAMSSKGMIGGTSGNWIWLPTSSNDIRDSLFPRFSKSDIKPGCIKSHLSAHNSAQKNISGLLIVDLIPINPVLVH